MKKTIIVILIFILLIGSVSATIDWETDTISYTPLWNYSTGVTGLLDLTSNNNDGTATGASYTVGKDAFDFSATTDKIILDNEANFDFERTDPFSIAAWVKFDSHTVNRMIVSKQVASGDFNGYVFWKPTTNRLDFTFRNDASSVLEVTTVNQFTDVANYHFVVMTYDGSSLTSGVKIYYDNVSQTLNTVTDTLTTTTLNNVDLEIGNRAGAFDFDGQMSDVAILDRALTATEVSEMFGEGRNLNPFTGPNITINDSTESTAVVKQVGSVSFSVTPTIIFSSTFNVTRDNTPIYGGYTFEVSSNNNNDMFCELAINGTVKANITRTQTSGDIGNAYISFPTEIVANSGTYLQELECRRISGVGLITISEAVGVGHFLVNQDNETLSYNASNVSQTVTSGTSYTLINSLNITMGNKTNTSAINPRKNQIIIDAAFTYTNNGGSTELPTTYANINGTNCTFQPRTVNSGDSGSVSYDCRLTNATANQTYTINFYGNGTNILYEGDITVKSFFLSDAEIIGGDGSFTGLTFSNDVFTTLASGIQGGNLNHDFANAFNKLSYAITTDADTTVSMYINVSNGQTFLTNIWQRDYTNGITGIIIGQDVFENIPKGDYNVSLHANCGTNGVTCTISGGATVGYLTDIITTVTNSFNVTAVNSWTNNSISDFNVTDGATVTSVNGTATYFSTEPFENLTISSTGYFDTIALNHNTSQDLNISLRQSDIKFRATEIITGNEVNPANFTINGTTKGTNESFYLATGNYNVTFSKTGWFNKTIEINVTALDNLTITITGVSSSVLNLTVQNIINNSFIQNFSGTITSPAIGFSDTFSTTTGQVLIPVINTQNFTIQLNTITGYSDFENSLNITGAEIIPPTINRTIQLYTNNSINFTIRDFATGTLLAQLVEIEMLGSTVTYDLNTSNGTLFIDQRNDDTYLTTFTTAGYGITTLFLTLENNAHLNVEVFMQTGLASKSFIVKNNNLVPIDGAILTFSTIVNGTSVVVAQGETDFSGRSTVQLDGSTSYQFTCIADGFDVFAGSVTPTESEYSITMIQSSTSLFTTQFDDVSYVPTFNYNAGEANATSGLFINSILGSLEYYGLTSTYNNVTFSQNITGSPGGGFPNITITGIDPTINSTLQVTYFFKSTGNPAFIFTESYFLPNVNGTNISIGGGLFDEVTSLPEDNPMRGIIGMILVMIGVMIFLGATRNMTIGVIGGLVATALNWHLELWPPNIAIITIIVGTILIIADNVR